MLLNRRPAVVLAVFTASVLAVTPPVSAGCLCDWLFGRPPVYAAAYPPAYAAAMPVAPVAAPAQVNYAPAQVNYAPAQAAYQVPTSAPTVTSQMPATTYAAQMPAYGSTTPLPSGYAGQYSSLYGGAPAAPIAPAPVTSFYGTGNVYPPTNVTTSYSAASPAVASPAVAAPVAAAPVVAVPARRGLLGWLFGQNYQTSYYAAPVTYYRPQTTVDPASGSTVTVQRPCTSYQYQVQRAPYYGLQPAAATPAAAAPPSCGVNGQPSYTQPAPPYSQPNQTFAPAPQPSTNGAPLSNGTPGEGFVPQPTLPPAGTQSSGMQATPPTYHSYPSSPSAPLTGAPPSTIQSYSPATPSRPSQNGAAEDQDNGAPSNNGNGSGSRNQPPVSDNETSLNSAWPSSESPSSYARPIPAPPATWNQTAPTNTPAPAPAPTPSRRYESSGGRTAALPAWGYKKISWSQPVDETVQQATYTAPAEVAPLPRSPEPARVAPAPARPRAYDDSGWRSAP